MQRPIVTHFFDEPTNTFSYVVQDPDSRACAIIDSVLDFDYAAGRTDVRSANTIIAFIREHDLDIRLGGGGEGFFVSGPGLPVLVRRRSASQGSRADDVIILTKVSMANLHRVFSLVSCLCCNLLALASFFCLERRWATTSSLS